MQLRTQMSITHSDSEAEVFIFSLKRQKCIQKKYLTFVILVRPHIYSPLVSLKAFNSKFDLNMFSKLSHFGGFKRGPFPPASLFMRGGESTIRFVRRSPPENKKYLTNNVTLLWWPEGFQSS